MREESSPFRVIVSGVEVVETCFSIVVITAVADGVVVCEVVICTIRNLAVSVSIVTTLASGSSPGDTISILFQICSLGADSLYRIYETVFFYRS